MENTYDAETAPLKAEVLTAADVEAIVLKTLSALRIYVVEADITAAQNSVRAVVEQSTF